MLRNLMISNTRPFFVQRFCLKNTGPRSSSLIAAETARKIGEVTISASSDTTMSEMRLKRLYQKRSLWYSYFISGVSIRWRAPKPCIVISSSCGVIYRLLRLCMQYQSISERRELLPTS